MVGKNDWLVSALVLNGKGGAKKINEKGLKKWKPKDGVLWVHLNLQQQGAHQWLSKEAGLDAWSIETLTDVEESRPRTVVHKDALLLVLRTVNLTPRSEPDDLVFLRLWATQNRLITVRLHPAIDFQDIAADFKTGDGPTDINSLIEEILDTSLDSTADTVSDMEDALDDIEERIIAKRITPTMYDDLSEKMRQLVVMHRFLAPERDALGVLSRRATTWFSDELDHATKECYHRMERIIEDIDLLRERVRINQDALNSHDVKRSQRNMYMLSVIATIFLPLSFLTGLFGMNVGGIPWSSDPNGLLITFFCITLIGFILILLFKKFKWI